ncbi:DIO1 [Branchiostoma lanceolatum]|uniref:Iodothyronine deiodinase n=1 Tax=Branchiostoma lanceolatum TaxID=7740 RepID=A0A8K0E6I3_BRALA|nr:DIO1 [Branchiostoma lanceolatum]
MRAVQCVSLTLKFAGLVVLYVMMRAVRAVVGVVSPLLRRKMDIYGAKRAQMYGTALALEDYIDLIFTSSSLWTEWKERYLNELQCETRVGGKAPDAPLLHMDGLTQARLVDFAKKGRPLVVNFGSCT